MIIQKAGLDPEALGGNVAVVIGGASGIGQTTAISLGIVGATVGIVDNDEKAGRQVVKIIESNGSSAEFFKENSLQNLDMEGLYRKIIKSLGKIDLAIGDDRCRGLLEFLPGMLERNYGVVSIIGNSPEAKSELASGDSGILTGARVGAFIFDSDGADDDLASAGLIGLLRFGWEYHGQIVDWKQGLTRLGLDTHGEKIQPEEPVIIQSSFTGTPGVISQALVEIMVENETEYNQLSILVRQVAKRMFLQGTGLTVNEWSEYARSMSHHLSEGDLEIQKVEEYLDRLRRLFDFMDVQETQAHRWAKHENNLESVIQSLDFRKTVVKDLITVIENQILPSI